MLAVLLCIPNAESKTGDPSTLATATPSCSSQTRPTPVGTLSLSRVWEQNAQHRNTTLGIGILRAYQGRGYGTEAIQWALKWAFRYANLHKVEIEAFEWNQGALRLYERLGFVKGGRKREHLWFDGRYRDLFELGMLEREWRERYGDEGIREVVLGAQSQR
jgi:RimJ/RimL family protein N-acetyltransferase